MDLTVRKIDFFGGLHGHYLELIVNIFIDQQKFDLSKPIFNKNGACHLKDEYPEYQPITKCAHWSYLQIPFCDNDLVIRIVPQKHDMLIAVTNSFLRAGEQSVDIKNLEIDTWSKLSKYPKMQVYKQQLEKDFGIRRDYPRSVLRNYCYSMFNDDENGIDTYRSFDSNTPRYHEFPFRSFFNFLKFIVELNKIAKFVNLEFQPTTELWRVHQEFLFINQGYHSEIKCQRILESIFSNTPMTLDLTIPEEAWINYQLGQTVNFSDDSFLMQNQYPLNTSEISEKIFEWIRSPK
jgi:hypothetical protein